MRNIFSNYCKCCFAFIGLYIKMTCSCINAYSTYFFSFSFRCNFFFLKAFLTRRSINAARSMDKAAWADFFSSIVIKFALFLYIKSNTLLFHNAEITTRHNDTESVLQLSTYFLITLLR